MAARRRQVESGKSGILPSPSGGPKSKGNQGSSSVGTLLAIVFVAALAAGAVHFRAEILAAVNQKQAVVADPAVAEQPTDDTVVDAPVDKEHSDSAATGTGNSDSAGSDAEVAADVREEREAPEPGAGAGNSESAGSNAEPAVDMREDKEAAEPEAASSKEEVNRDRLFTVEELAQHDGSDESKPIYMALIGQVFDVTKGKQHYGKGGGYAFFSGRDGSRSFVSGDFTEEGLTDNVTGLDNSNVIGLEDWLTFYHKDYTYAGKLIGTFYDSSGRGTPKLAEYQQMLKVAQGAHLAEEEMRRLFPPCNSHWAQGKGGAVWCSKESGGIKRDWVGVPRRFYKAGSTDFRCVCVRNTGAPSIGEDDHRKIGDLGNPNMRSYDFCHPESVTCAIKDD